MEWKIIERSVVKYVFFYVLLVHCNGMPSAFRIGKQCAMQLRPGQSYCGWKKSCTTLDGWNMLKPYPPYQGFILLIIEWILYIVIYKLLIYYIDKINNLIYPINWVDISVILLYIYIINNPSSWWDKPPINWCRILLVHLSATICKLWPCIFVMCSNNVLKW